MGARIVVAVPSHDSVPFAFANDLAHLSYRTVADGFREVDAFGIVGITSTVIHQARNSLMKRILEADVPPTHILWLDSDMRFPSDAALRLLRHNVDVVGANYVKREIPTKCVAFKHVGEDGEGSVRCETLPESTGLEEVDAIGMGCVMIRTACLSGLPDPYEKPWFEFTWLPKLKAQRGEDIFFFKLLREHGVKVYVDHDLSKAVGHVGPYEYRLSDLGREQ